MWQSLIGPVTSVLSWATTSVTNYFEHKQKIKVLQQEAEIKRAERESASIADSDTQSVIDQKGTWKDEYIVLIVTLPVVGCFIPGLVPYIKTGFETLSTVVPEWYVSLYGVVVLSVMGARLFHRYVLPRIKK